MKYLSTFLFAASTLFGGTLLDVSGTQDFPLVLLANHAAAAAFTLTSPVSNFQFSARIDCPNCRGVAYLTNSLDIGFNASNLLAASAILNSQTPQFTGLSLGAGTYFVTLSNQSGVMTWHGSTRGTVLAPGGSVDAYFKTLNSATLAPASRFTVFTEARLLYTVTNNNVNAVPEPATSLLLGPAILALTLCRRKFRILGETVWHVAKTGR